MVFNDVQLFHRDGRVLRVYMDYYKASRSPEVLRAGYLVMGL
jgi:hypothetical protein